MFVSADVMDPDAEWTKAGHLNSMRTYATIVVEKGDGDYYKAPLVNEYDADGKILLPKGKKLNFWIWSEF